MWYSYRAATDGKVIFEIYGGGMTMVNTVYTGSSLADLTEVVSSGGDITFTASAGTTYWLQAGGATELDTGIAWVTVYDTRAVGNDVLPSIVGDAWVGQTLSVDPGVWHPQPVTLTYQWAVDGVDVPGATGQTYAVTSAELGKRLTVTLTGTREGYATSTSTSAPTAAVTTAPLKALTCTVKVKGKAKVGKKLRAATGCTTTGVAMRYQWFRGAKKIRKAKKAAYRVTRRDRGKKLSVRVTFTKDGYTTLVKRSKKVRVRR